VTNPSRRAGGVARHSPDPRHRAREAALQILYQWVVGGVDVDRAAETVLGPQWPDARPPDEPVRAFAAALARETAARLEPIDRLIADTTERWRPERMAVIDRLILRMSTCELLRGEIRPAVVINEALELARTFSTEDAVKFINGMLDAIRKKLEDASTP
jgi:N utilization substance protein B